MTKPYPQPNPGCCCSMLARWAVLEPSAEGALASLKLTLLFLFPELIKGFPETLAKLNFVLVTAQVWGQREEEGETAKSQQESKEVKMGRRGWEMWCVRRLWEKRLWAGNGLLRSEAEQRLPAKFSPNSRVGDGNRGLEGRNQKVSLACGFAGEGKRGKEGWGRSVRCEVAGEAGDVYGERHRGRTSGR